MLHLTLHSDHLIQMPFFLSYTFCAYELPKGNDIGISSSNDLDDCIGELSRKGLYGISEDVFKYSGDIASTLHWGLYSDLGFKNGNLYTYESEKVLDWTGVLSLNVGTSSFT